MDIGVYRYIHGASLHIGRYCYISVDIVTYRCIWCISVLHRALVYIAKYRHISVYIGTYRCISAHIGVYRYIHRALGHGVSLNDPAPKNTEQVCVCVYECIHFGTYRYISKNTECVCVCV